MSDLIVKFDPIGVLSRALMLKYVPPTGVLLETTKGKALLLGYSTEQKMIVAYVTSHLNDVTLNEIEDIEDEDVLDKFDATNCYPSSIHVWGVRYDIREDRRPEIGSNGGRHFVLDPVHAAGSKAKQSVRLTIDEVNSFLLNQKVAEEMLLFARNSTSPRTNWLMGNSSGETLIFMLENRVDSLLCPIPIYSRVHYMAFVRERPNSVLIANRNFTKIPQWSEGLVVAYSQKYIGNSKNDIHNIQASSWYLGCVMKMGLQTALVADLKVNVNGDVSITGKKCFLFHSDNYSMHFLSWVNMDMVGLGGFVLASGIGPSIYPFTKSEKKKLEWNEFCVKQGRVLHCLKAKPTGKMKSKLLEALGFAHSEEKLKHYSTKGAYIVILSGPLSHLMHERTNKNFYCPIIHAKSHGRCHDIVGGGFEQAYAEISGEKRKSAEFTTLTGSGDKVNVKLAKMSAKRKLVKMQCFDAALYPKGLIFLFERNEVLDRIGVSSEFHCEENFSNSDLFAKYKGIVLSHWVGEKSTTRIGEGEIKIAKRFYSKSQGFGSGRRVNDSIGLVAYSGEKGSSRAIPNPRYVPIVLIVHSKCTSNVDSYII